MSTDANGNWVDTLNDNGAEPAPTREQFDAVTARAEALLREARDAELSNWPTPVHRANWLAKVTALPEGQRAVTAKPPMEGSK